MARGEPGYGRARSSRTRAVRRPALLGRFAVGARQHHGVALGIAQPHLTMRRSAGLALGRVAVRLQNDLGPELAGSRHGGVEVIDLEPQQHTVAVGASPYVAYGAVVMLNIPGVQLENELAVDGQPLVLRAAVRALAPEQALIPAAARLDILDGDQGLRAHVGHQFFIITRDMSRIAPIGTVESPLTDPASAPKQGDEGAPDARLVFEPAVAPGLDGIHAGDEIIVLTWLHRADRDTLTVHPRGDPARPLQGVFSTRSPHRPNPIGLHRVQVTAVDGATIRVRGLEAVDGTPIVDVKATLDDIVEER
jgi:tRNA-Thr(GGU) m(6)t(6)A37 methyltransferase TsaA